MLSRDLKSHTAFVTYRGVDKNNGPYIFLDTIYDQPCNDTDPGLVQIFTSSFS